MISLSDRRSLQHLGFTLIELLVVLAILGFALVLISGFRPPGSQHPNIDATAAELAAQLRLVRSAAIVENHSVALELDLTTHRYRTGNTAPKNLPKELGLQLITVSGERLAEAAGNIRFNPDGSSTGGRIVLEGGSRRVAVGVEWLTGRVSVVDVP